ncbi:RNA-metabolising metallo-beta-lactamase [Thermaerobacter marianensis DSM 12885]|uniref:Ribonuclease J n=1 Tax=Thermaerobacter marianensis (strain ATCC 700841 / DSM 12885 / JCM 10246 / 7p75a) TaxID=644966 RepID=E6SK09_THEM7|nr:RNA-metabolising metallo-beta-lactamase [Thermaerobacter marianensis DSM 12885]
MRRPCRGGAAPPGGGRFARGTDGPCSTRRWTGIAAQGKGSAVTIVPLGGLGEIGKNMMVLETEQDLIVIDAGLAFPGDDMPGVDVVIPDYGYLIERKQKLRGIFLTHGHEDHIGGIPYLLKEIQAPIYATRLTLGLVERKLEEDKLALPPRSRAVRPGERIRAGSFTVEPFLVNHSIPDSVGFAIRTPVGLFIHTGDFKFDQTPIDGRVADYQRLAAYGAEGVHVLMMDSTNAERPGVTGSERQVGEALANVFRQARGRILIASFASHLHRLQQVFDLAAQFKRRLAVIGRSMENAVEVAIKLGYLRDTGGVLTPADKIGDLAPERVVVLMTGSQGEPLSALARAATGELRKLELIPGDTVVIAANPIPGNEKLVQRTIDNLFRRGCQVVYGPHAGVHVSGHGSREELRLMLNLTRPRFFIPVHGEYRHLLHNAELARSVGIPDNHILIGENGTVFEITASSARIRGKVAAGAVMVDGLGVGDVGNVVLRDRRQLAQDGVLIVAMVLHREQRKVVSGPDLITRGFVYMRESEDLLAEARERAVQALNGIDEQDITEWSNIKAAVRDALGKFLYERTGRRPVILPIVLEV